MATQSANNAEILEASKILANDFVMRVLLIERIIVGAIGIVFITIMLIYQRKFVMHTNTKMVVGCHCVFSLQTCTSVVMDSSYNLITYLTQREESLLKSGLFCLLTRGIIAYVTLGMAFSFSIIALERTISTIYYKTYEQHGVRIGIILVSIELLVPLITTIVLVRNFPLDQHQGYCSAVTPGNLDEAKICSYLLLFMEVFSTVVFQTIVVINKRRRKDLILRGALTERYQVDENIRIINLILPLMYTHASISIICTVSYGFVVSSLPNFEKARYPIIEESTNQLHVYGILMPIAVLVGFKLQKVKIRKQMVKNGMVTAVNSVDEMKYRTMMTMEYHKTLKTMWS